jgi:hypothetical protein
MCEENNTIPGMYNMSINDDNSEELIAHREKKRKKRNSQKALDTSCSNNHF